MIRYFDFQHEQLVNSTIENADYIVVETPSHEELQFIKQHFELSLAESETTSPHLTIPICKHFENRTTLQLFAPVEMKFANTLSVEHKTLPLFILMRDEQLLLLLPKKNPTLQLPILSKAKTEHQHDVKQLFITIITSLTTQYIQHAEKLIQQLETSETVLRDSRRNDEFIILLEIQESFLTLKGALDANISMLNRTLEFLDFSPKQVSEIENAMEKMTYIRNTFDNYSLICQNLRDSLATFISNDLNFTMRVLAVITIVIAIPNLFFGFFGMNVSLPLAQNEAAFIIILGLVLLFIWLTIHFLKRKRLY
ncbi:MAG: CorA family divalent cation transporter [Culicoidibacterales bacterium]